jgi:hypothetical protein
VHQDGSNKTPQTVVYDNADKRGKITDSLIKGKQLTGKLSSQRRFPKVK